MSFMSFSNEIQSLICVSGELITNYCKGDCVDYKLVHDIYLKTHPVFQNPLYLHKIC